MACWALTAGMCGTQLARTMPLMKKMVETAQRARIGNDRGVSTFARDGSTGQSFRSINTVFVLKLNPNHMTSGHNRDIVRCAHVCSAVGFSSIHYKLDAGDRAKVSKGGRSGKRTFYPLFLQLLE